MIEIIAIALTEIVGLLAFHGFIKNYIQTRIGAKKRAKLKARLLHT